MKPTASNQNGGMLRVLLLCIAALLCLSMIALPAMAVSDSPAAPTQAQLMDLNVPFVANTGQQPADVKFYADTFYGRAFVTGTDITHAVEANTSEGIKGVALKEQFVTADGTAVSFVPVGEDPAETKVSYFIGNDQSKWQTGLPTYNLVSLGEIYPGITVKAKAHGANIEKIFFVSPGISPDTIRVKVQGANSLRIKEDGSLAIATGDDEVSLTAPKAFQDGQPVSVAYRVLGEDTYGFAVGDYDHAKALVIDPSLEYSTYLGGSGTTDYGQNIAIDSTGNAFIIGRTNSANFPVTSGTFQTSNAGGTDVMISKMNPTGTGLVYSTYLGGVGQDTGSGIAIDGAGNAYITGQTNSAAFPVTSGAFQTTIGGGQDGFVSKLNPTGTGLIYSTYLGGSDSDLGAGIVVDSTGNTYITGQTLSGNFPITSGVFQTGKAGDFDAYVTELNPSGTSLVYSTYLGGTGTEYGQGITSDSTGNAYIIGYTASTNFPTTTGAFQTTNAGGSYDVYVSKLNPSGTSLVYSTYLGGTGLDLGAGIVVDNTGNAFIIGRTNSAAFPTTSGAFQTTNAGDYDAYVTELNPSGTSLVYSTYLGGTGTEFGQGITLDSTGNAFVIGRTNSAAFPTTQGAFQTSNAGGYDAYVTELNPSGTSLVYSTYLGGTGTDYGQGITLDSTGNAYITGYTNSAAFPTTSGTFQTSIATAFDAFVAKFSFAAASPVADFSAGTTSGTAPLTVAFTDASTNSPTSWAWDFGDSDSTNATEQNPVHTYAAVGTYTVTLTATNAAGSDDETKTGYITVTAPLPPVAGFAADTVSGTAPLAVQFTDQSYNATAWAWDFEDDGIVDNTTQNPLWTYTTAGTYTVNLTVTGTTGSDSEVKSGYITVNAPPAPVADFSGTPTSGYAPLTVTFTDASTNSPTSWAWDFGDGSSTNATVKNPVHTYAAAGTYTVNLTAANAGGSDSELKTGYITVSPVTTPPVAGFSVMLDGDGKMPHGLAPITVSFTDASTGTVATYLWEYRNYDDTTWTAFSSAQNPTDIVFSEAGTYDIRLNASNSGGSSTKTLVHAFAAGTLHDYLTPITSGTVSGDLFIDSRSPWSDTAATYSYTLPSSGSNVVWARVFVNDYSGSGTNNFPLRITTEFDADGDGTFETLLGAEDCDIQSEMNAETSENQPYTYPLNDHVKKVYSDYEAWYDVTSLISSTTPQIRVTSSDIGAPVGSDGGYDGRLKAVTLVVAYNDGDSDQIRYIVNHGNDWMAGSSATTFNAGSFPAGWSSAEVRGVAFSSTDASYTFPNSGSSITKTALGSNSYYKYNSFNATSALIAGSSNDFGFTNNAASFKICLATLKAKYPGVTAPVAAFSGNPISGTSPLTVVFTDASTNAPTSWAWDFGDSDTTNATVQNPVHTYASTGTYTVTLTATNSAGSNTATQTGYITVSTGVIALPGQSLQPTDPDHDGLYEDLNGNGMTDFNDVQLYFRQMDWIAENEPIALFDFNINTLIDFNDIQILFREI